MPDDDRQARLREFVGWVRDHVSGDEKGEAQVYLDRLFRAFGQPGILDVKGKLEFRVRKDKGGTSFADLVWKPVVLIEMKKRGEDLSRHLQQAFDYWIRLVPNRPQYAVLCNFDEFRVYDFNADLNEPQDVVAIDELPDRYGPLAFLFPTNEEPIFKVDRLKVTRAGADVLAACYNRLAARADVGPARAQRFILQILIALFSEDIGLLRKYFVAELLRECTDPPKAFDLLGGLFRAMATPEPARGGRYKDVPYFNGGVFAEPAPIELESEDVTFLNRAAMHNWAGVSPDVFGTLFQHSMGAEERHAYGAHYTSPIDIMKIVGPTIVDPWRKAIDAAKSVSDVDRLLQRLRTLRVLDPACGSGNFLYIAYREMKRLETALLERGREIAPKSDRFRPDQRAFGFVTTKQFCGMDILPFAVELAKVTLTLAHKLSIDELHVDEPALPLDNLDRNIVVADALIDEKGERTAWPAADVIIGNPPFLGAKRLKPERGADYVNAVRALYPDVPGMADYCVYWFRRAHDHLPECTEKDPFAGRAGLVGTQNIRNNKSRVGGLDHIVATGGVIVEAVDNQPWSGEANVHVSIANWVKRSTSGSDERLHVPTARRLWYKIDPRLPLFDGEDMEERRRVSTPGRRAVRRVDKSYELMYRLGASINSALTDQVDLSSARILECNRAPQRAFQGVVPGYRGFVLTLPQRRTYLRDAEHEAEVIRPFLVGRELLSGDGFPTRAVIDFAGRTMLEASRFRAAFQHVEKSVLPEVRKKITEARRKNVDMVGAREQHLDRWWQFWNVREGLRDALKQVDRCLCCSRVTKRPVFCFVDVGIVPDGALEVFAFDDDYSFGILQSDAHWQWFIAKCSKLTERFRYTPESVFDTFPWPQFPTKKQIRAVAAAGREIRRLRDEALKSIKGGLRALYRTLELPGKSPLKDAHAALDRAVLNAYGFDPKGDILKQLLDLNLAVAKRIDDGEPVTAPGVPPTYGDPADLITEDCIRPR